MTTPQPSTRFALSYSLVKQFHETFKHPVATTLTPNTLAQRRLRVALIAEELGELCQALGVAMELSVFPTGMNPEGLGKPDSVVNGYNMIKWVGPEHLCHSDDKVDITEAADALADLDYVVQGSNLVFGIPAPVVLEEVHDSNMSKLGADGQPIWDAMGKVVKGPNYRKPDIAAALGRYDVAELWRAGAA